MEIVITAVKPFINIPVIPGGLFCIWGNRQGTVAITINAARSSFVDRRFDCNKCSVNSDWPRNKAKRRRRNSMLGISTSCDGFLRISKSKSTVFWNKKEPENQ